MSAGHASHVTARHYFRCLSHTGARLSDGVSIYRAVCGVCLLSGRQPIHALVRLSVCRPTCSSALQQPLSLCVSDFSWLEISRGSWQPEAICHSGPFCSALLQSPVCCWSVPVCFFPWGPHANPYPKKPNQPVERERKKERKKVPLL